MKKRNLTPIILAVIVLVLAGVVFLVTRPKYEVQGVSKNVYDNAAQILTLIQSNDIPDAIAQQKYSTDSDAQDVDLLESYSDQLYSADVKTKEETDYVAAVYYALCNRYYESMLNVLSTSDELELYGYVTNDEAIALAQTFKSKWETAISVIETKNIGGISSFIVDKDAAAASVEYNDFMDIATGMFTASSDTYPTDDTDMPTDDDQDLPEDSNVDDSSNDDTDDYTGSSSLGTGGLSGGDFGGLSGSSGGSSSGLGLSGNGGGSLGLGLGN